MAMAKIVIFSPEEMTRTEIHNFVKEGLKDVQENNLFDFNDTFNEIRKKV
jgi:hypothetical protein